MTIAVDNLSTNDQRTVWSNARNMAQKKPCKLDGFGGGHRATRNRRHQVAVYDFVTLGHFDVCVEVVGASGAWLGHSTKHMATFVRLASERCSNLRTGAADPSLSGIVRRTRNPEPMAKPHGRAVELAHLKDMNRPTAQRLLHPYLRKDTFLMNEKNIRLNVVSVRHGWGSLARRRGYHCGENANG
ncbi:hypothetical protein Xthr_15520 [Xanthomonas citri pv. thirumalacharii]|nr:hypothetical protein [Xanthomonas citri pv. thirumalacharii]